MKEARTIPFVQRVRTFRSINAKELIVTVLEVLPQQHVIRHVHIVGLVLHTTYYILHTTYYILPRNTLLNILLCRPGNSICHYQTYLMPSLVSLLYKGRREDSSYLIIKSSLKKCRIVI